MKILNKKLIIVVSLLCISLLASFKIRATTSSLTGSCAAMMSLKPLNQVEYGVWETQISQGITSTNTDAVDAMVLINFSESKIYINLTKATVATSMDLNAWWYRTRVNYATETLAPIALLVQDGPLPNSYLLSAQNNEILNLI